MAGKSKALQGATGGALDMFRGAEQALQPLVEGGFASPYVQFFHPQSPNAKKIQAALGSLDEGTPVYVNGDEFTHLDPMKFILCPVYWQFFALSDGDGKPTEVLLPSMKQSKEHREGIEAVILVLHDNGDITPARCRFKGPKAPAARTAVHALSEDVKSVEWKGKSKEHALTVKSGLPDWAWATIVVTVTKTNPKTPYKTVNGKKVKNLPYDLATGVVHPTSVIDLANLAKLNKQPEFKDTLQACMDDYKKGVEELKGLVPA